MRVLVIGNGAREHAIVKSLAESGANISSFMSHMNPGIVKYADHIKYGAYNDFDALLEFKNIDLAVIGSEKAVISGMVDYLNTIDIPVVAPTKAAARIETSKIFARKLLDNHRIKGNPDFDVINDLNQFDSIASKYKKLVIKPDGYTGGIGVKIIGKQLNNFEEARFYAKELLHDNNQFLIEEFLEGHEFTIHAFCDGSRIELTPMVHDYRTNEIRHSLGSVSAPNQLWPGITKEDVDEAKKIIRNAFRAMFQEYGVMYQGVLNGQFIKTEDGVYLLEFNCRFGDPEALNVLKLLKTDFLELCSKIIDNNMGKPEFHNNIGTMALYLVPKGYPDKIVHDSVVEVPENFNIDYYWGHIYQETPNDPIRTTNKRTLALFRSGESISEIRKFLIASAEHIKGDLEYSKIVGQEFD
ncbi:MAG: ATP-grasp domain-containing protein [Candidatus Thorarchaeota archaeon]